LLTAVFLVAVLAVFLFLFIRSFRYASDKLGPRLHQIETTAPR
jgi:hypothetical protein